MQQKRSLRPREIRALRLNKYAIFDIIEIQLKEICYINFLLPQNTDSVHVDWIIDNDRYELFLFAYRSSEELDKEAAIEYTKNLPGDALESLFINTQGKSYHSVKNPSFFKASTIGDIKGNHIWKGNEWNNLLTIWSDKIRPIKKHELRFIRLSKQGVLELIWEYFMRVGDDFMDIPEEDSDNLKNIYYMKVEENFDELKLYTVNTDEVSLICFEKVNKYFDDSHDIISDCISKKMTNRQRYTSMILPESFITNKMASFHKQESGVFLGSKIRL